MPTPLLTTKLYIPSIRSELVSRPRLIERLNEGMTRKLTLVSAQAGYGKTAIKDPSSPVKSAFVSP
jgi:LuxR family maltose regulon positive regulatory protein